MALGSGPAEGEPPCSEPTNPTAEGRRRCVREGGEREMIRGWKERDRNGELLTAHSAWELCSTGRGSRRKIEEESEEEGK